MAFSTALSGLNAASADLDITSNNIANSNTTGFKKSRGEFADVYPVSAYGRRQTIVGNGVSLVQVSQDFSQGDPRYTENAFDLAISGDGFFVLSEEEQSLSPLYTRAGAFGVDADGYVVNPTGQYLQAYPVDADGNALATSIDAVTSVQIPQTFGSPAASTTVEISANLPASAGTLNINNFDPSDASTYTNSASVTVYDSLGTAHTLTTYFIKVGNRNSLWETRAYLGTTALTPVTAASTELDFDASGNLVVPANGEVAYTPLSLTNGAANLSLTIDYTSGIGDTTQYGSEYSLSAIGSDGNTTGRLTSVEVSEEGVIQANYNNGEISALGKIAMAQFRNAQGLLPVGNTLWSQSLASGDVLSGEANSGSFGLIRGGALEASNVNLTAELVNLIKAQRNFQANAKSIETESAITQTIIQI